MLEKEEKSTFKVSIDKFPTMYSMTIVSASVNHAFQKIKWLLDNSQPINLALFY